MPGPIYDALMASTPEQLRATRNAAGSIGNTTIGASGWENYQEAGLTYDEYRQVFNIIAPGSYAEWKASQTGDLATTGTGATGITGALGALPTRVPTAEELAVIRQAQANWQGIFEQQYGIPTAGRSPYEKWLAGQWTVPAAEYAMRAYGGGLGPALSSPDLGFESYLQGRQGSLASISPNYLAAITSMGPAAQRKMYEALPDYIQGEAMLGGLAGKMPSWLAAQRLAQEAGAPALRRFELRPETVTGQDTFLNYLARRFGLGGLGGT